MSLETRQRHYDSKHHQEIKLVSSNKKYIFDKNPYYVVPELKHVFDVIFSQLLLDNLCLANIVALASIFKNS